MSLDVDASVVLAPYLEPLVRGRRVAILGDSTGGLALGLIERGARLIHVYDPDPVRAAQAAAQRQDMRGLSIAPLPTGEMLVRDGAFDAVIVPDLSIFSKNDEVIGRARKLTSINGAAVVASPNPERKDYVAIEGRRVPNYYELYDAVSLQFPEVRMLGQAPFRGYVVADFAPDEEPDVTVDTSMLPNGAEDPRWFIALGSRMPTHLDPYVIVQMPTIAEVPEEPPTQKLAAKQAVLVETEETRGRVKDLEAQLEIAREAVRKAEVYRAAALRTETVEAQLQAREEQLAQSEARAGDSHVRVGQLEGKVRDLDEELRRQRDRAFRLSKELEDERKNRTKVEVELGMMRRASELPAKLDRTKDDESAAKIASLEAELASAKAELANAKSELANTKAELAGARADLSNAKSELSNAKAEIASLRAEIASKKASYEAELAASKASHEAELAASKASHDAQLAAGKASHDAELGAARAHVTETLQADAALVSCRAQVQKLEAELVEARAKLIAFESAVAQAREDRSRMNAKNAESTSRISVLERELAERNERIAALDASMIAQAEAADARVSRLLAEREAGGGAQVIGVPNSQVDEMLKEHELEVDRYERLLLDRSHELGALRVEVAHREQLVRELLIVLEESSGKKADPSIVSLGDTLQALHAQLDQLSALAARREADLHAANWRIQQLEQGQPVATEGSDSELEAALVASRAELDVMRQSLAQEREARAAVEQRMGMQAMWDQANGKTPDDSSGR